MAKKIKAKPKARKKTLWQIHLKKVYTKMKAKDKSTKLSSAMKKAKITYKRKK